MRVAKELEDAFKCGSGLHKRLYNVDIAVYCFSIGPSISSAERSTVGELVLSPCLQPWF